MIFGVVFTLIGVLAILDGIFLGIAQVMGFHPSQQSPTVAVILRIIEIGIGGVFLAAGIWNFTRL
jgi:hypothetical protein